MMKCTKSCAQKKNNAFLQLTTSNNYNFMFTVWSLLLRPPYLYIAIKCFWRIFEHLHNYYTT